MDPIIENEEGAEEVVTTPTDTTSDTATDTTADEAVVSDEATEEVA